MTKYYHQEKIVGDGEGGGINQHTFGSLISDMDFEQRTRSMSEIV